MASSEPAAAVLGHPEFLDVEPCMDESVPLERPVVTVTSPTGGHLVQQSEAPHTGCDVTVQELAPDPRVAARLVGDFLSRMHVTRPEIIRAVPVRKIFRGLARPLRRQGDYYHLSRVTSSFGAFWSHSWHGSVCRKIFTVFFFHKGTAATILSVLAAFFCYIAFGLAILPAEDGHSWWCLSIGCVTYVLVMLVWQPQQLVFLDRVCIAQCDTVLQTEGLLSLGAILKSADYMMVLWDSSWARRLWCIFELAAFLHSRSPREKTHISIRPTMLGFAICASWFACVLGGFALHTVLFALSDGYGFHTYCIFMACCFVIFWYIAHLAREYCRDIHTMCKQIRHFSITRAECCCCSTDHKVPGSDIPGTCDRVIILHCIKTWFGSVEAFEHYVQNEVYDLLVDQLSNHVISYWRLAEASPVLFWVNLDRAAPNLRLFFQSGVSQPSHLVGSLLFLNGLCFWLGVFPILFRVLFRLAWILQAECACQTLDWLKSLLTLLPSIFIFSLFILIESVLLPLLPEPLDLIGFTLITIPLAALAWNCLSVKIDLGFRLAAAAIELLFYHKLVNPTAMPVIVTAIACGVLRSASARDRLGGGTFRLLSLGLLFACCLLFLRAISSVGVLLAVASKGPVSLRVEALLLAQVPILFVSCFGCKAAYGTLAKEGLPKFKMALRAEKGRKWLLTLLAVGYFVTSLHQVLWGSASLFGGFPALGALRCFVVAACAHVCCGPGVRIRAGVFCRVAMLLSVKPLQTRDRSRQSHVRVLQSWLLRHFIEAGMSEPPAAWKMTAPWLSVQRWVGS
eukprot:s3379_g2.t1